VSQCRARCVAHTLIEAVLTDGQNVDRVRRLQKTLDLHHSDSNTSRDDQLSKYRRFLSLIAGESSRDLKQMSLHDLQALPEYHAWTSADSSMLFLHGCNHESQIVSQSWLSLATADFIAHLQQSESHVLVAYTMCSPEHTIEDTVKSLLSQLLDLEPAVVKEATDLRDIEAHVSHDTNSSNSGQANDAHMAKLLEGFSWALRRVVDRCQSPVHLVISRPETCKDGRLWTWALIKNLLDLVSHSQNRVKVLLEVRTELWNIGGRLCDVDRSLLDSGKLVISRQDQRKLDCFR